MPMAHRRSITRWLRWRTWRTPGARSTRYRGTTNTASPTCEAARASWDRRLVRDTMEVPMGVTVLWNSRQWARAIAALPASGAFPYGTVIVPRGAFAAPRVGVHGLRAGASGHAFC